MKTVYKHVKQAVIQGEGSESTLNMVLDLSAPEGQAVKQAPSWKLLFAGKVDEIRQEFSMSLAGAFDSGLSKADFASNGHGFIKHVDNIVTDRNIATINYFHNIDLAGIAIQSNYLGRMKYKALMLPYDEGSATYCLLPLTEEKDIATMCDILKEILDLRRGDKLNKWFGNIVKLVTKSECEQVMALHSSMYNSETKVH